MSLRFISFLGVLGLVLLLGGCGSGSSGSSGVAGVGSCADGNFCITSCSLGCSDGGCGISEIAVNQKLTMVFNRTVDPASVNSTTFSLRTTQGERPAGQAKVVMDGGTPTNVVIFTPEVVSTGSQTSFGFASGKEYLLYLPGSDQSAETILSTNGFPLSQGLLCTLTASRGVVDPDGKNPEASMVSPLNGAINVPPDTAIEVAFSELVTSSTLENPSSVDINVSINGGAPTLVTCQRTVLAAANPNASLPMSLLLQPSIILPPKADVEVKVKGEIRDLAGNPCVPMTFTFKVSDANSTVVELKEDFNDITKLDKEASGGKWGNGKAEPGLIGGSGILGPFDKEMFVGVQPIGNVLTLSTNLLKIKADYTLTEQEITVTNGIFEFESFIVPNGLTINFVGSNVPKIFARGQVLINGTIKVNGNTAASHDGMSLLRGAGAAANCGGGIGGSGALKLGTGLAGGPVAFPKGSARYNSAAANASAGQGGGKFPTGAITFNGYAGWVCAQTAPGGTGGSNFTRGMKGYGQLTGTNINLTAYAKTDVPPDNLPGPVFSYLPILPAEASTIQFLAGGSGGGGGGSTPMGSFKGSSIDWHSGQGGGSGGGALLIRAGGNLGISQYGVLESRGGSSPTPQGYKRAMPGGGGSGGNILLQTSGDFLCQGKVWAPGGAGGHYQEMANYDWDSHSYGGNGGSGYLRVEAVPAPMSAQLVGFVPTATNANVGTLLDRDQVTGVRSKFYPSKRLMPYFDHFIIEARENTVPVTYSDDSRLGKVCTFNPGQGTAVSVFLQGANLDSQGNPIPSTLSKWVRTAPDLNDVKNWFGGKASARPTAVRWIIIFDKSVLSGSSAIEVEKMTVFVQG